MHSEEFSGHQAWAALADAREKIAALGENAVSHEIEPAMEILHGLSLAETVKSVSGLLIDPEQMDRLREVAADIASSATEGVENSVDVSGQLTGHRDELAAVLRALPVLPTDPGAMGSYGKAVSEFVSHLSSITTRINELDAEAHEALEEYRVKFDSEQKNLQEVLRQTHEAISSKIASTQEAIDTIRTDVEGQKTRLDAALNQFSTDTAERNAKADEDFKQLKNEIVERFDDQQAKLDQDAVAIIEELKKYEEQAKQLVDASARSTITADYGSRAKQERRAALLWSLGAVLVALGGLLSISIGMANLHEMGVSETLWKSSTTLVLLAVAGYMGKEAAAHRKEERDAKRAQLDLNAFNPFLTLMDKEDARELRKEFAHRIFNRPLANLKSENGFSFGEQFRRAGKQEPPQDSDE